MKGSAIVSDFVPIVPGIGFSGYRSFAEWAEFLFPTKVTVLAGINNSGKSNVLRFIQNILPLVSAKKFRAKAEIQAVERPLGFKVASDLTIGFPIAVDGELRTANPPPGGSSLEDYQRFITACLAGNDGIYWSRYQLGAENLTISTERVNAAIRSWPGWDHRYNSVLRALGGGAVNPENVMLRLLTSIEIPTLPRNVVTIASSRRVEATEETEPDWLSGRGIVRALAEIERPLHEQWSEVKPKWHAINRFVQMVLGDPDARLNVPHDFSTIQVETPSRVLPLASLGSGVEQVIVLAAAATITTNSLVCLEEPETNLHPLLQKKLVRYLNDETDNQYVIATHSSHFFDDARSTTYHIQLTDSGSRARLALRPHELVHICNDLGYRPSDILQANAVIWVEGPSDRVYLRSWLALVDADLQEGIDYSIMFYGGRLLSHLSAGDESINEFISLRRLNRHSAILIDSDKSGARRRLNATKKRLQSEFDASDAPGFAWVTKCNTIENYVAADLLESALHRTHPTIQLPPFGQWQNPFAGLRVDKVAVARAVAEALEIFHLDMYDLREQISRLRQFIRDANGQTTAQTSKDE